MVELRTIRCNGRPTEQLLVDGASVMLDADHLVDDLRRAAVSARGACYVAGLGLGLMVRHLIDLPRVARIVCVEIDPRIIELIGPRVAHPRVTLRAGDAYRDFAGGPFDWMYFDCDVQGTRESFERWSVAALPHLQAGGTLERWNNET